MCFLKMWAENAAQEMWILKKKSVFSEFWLQKLFLFEFVWPRILMWGEVLVCKGVKHVMKALQGYPVETDRL